MTGVWQTTLPLPSGRCSDFLSLVANATPDKVALRHKGQEWTYAKLAQDVRRARSLLQAHCKAGDNVALMLGNNPAYVIWALAAYDLGLVVVPLYVNAPMPEIVQRCCFCRPAVAIVEDQRFREIASASPAIAGAFFAATVYSTGQDERRTARGEGPRNDERALMGFSSGSTGQPKAIPLTHANLIAGRVLFQHAALIRPDDVSVHFLPLTHIYGWMAATAVLGAGGTLVLHERYDFDDVMRSLAQWEGSILFGVPQTILDLEQHGEKVRTPLAGLRYVNTGSAPLAPEIMREVSRRLDLVITTGYGLTEAAPLSHSPVFAPELIDTSMVGYPVPNTTVRLIDPENPDGHGQDLPQGELIVSGPQVAQGYLLADGAYDRTAWLPGGFFRTGDLVERDPLGRLRIVGRLKNIIKYKGYSIAPAELENMLAQHEAVIDCAVLGLPDRTAGEIPVAYVVRRSGSALSAEDLLAFMRTRVAAQKSIRAVHFVSEIPRSNAGKVLAKELIQTV